jgi:hypothetical protein
LWRLGMLLVIFYMRPAWIFPCQHMGGLGRVWILNLLRKWRVLWVSPVLVSPCLFLRKGCPVDYHSTLKTVVPIVTEAVSVEQTTITGNFQSIFSKVSQFEYKTFLQMANLKLFIKENKQSRPSLSF